LASNFSCYHFISENEKAKKEDDKLFEGFQTLIAFLLLSREAKLRWLET
jgi:hypothetical protein